MDAVEEPSPLPCSFFSPLPSANREGLFISHWPLSGRSDCLVGWDPQGRIPFLNLLRQTGMQGSQYCLPGMRVIFQMLKGQSGLKHGNRSKRQALKSASTDLGTTDVGE